MSDTREKETFIEFTFEGGSCQFARLPDGQLEVLAINKEEFEETLVNIPKNQVLELKSYLNRHYE